MASCASVHLCRIFILSSLLLFWYNSLLNTACASPIVRTQHLWSPHPSDYRNHNPVTVDSIGDANDFVDVSDLVDRDNNDHGVAIDAARPSKVFYSANLLGHHSIEEAHSFHSDVRQGQISLNQQNPVPEKLVPQKPGPQKPDTDKDTVEDSKPKSPPNPTNPLPVPQNGGGPPNEPIDASTGKGKGKGTKAPPTNLPQPPSPDENAQATPKGTEQKSKPNNVPLDNTSPQNTDTEGTVTGEPRKSGQNTTQDEPLPHIPAFVMSTAFLCGVSVSLFVVAIAVFMSCRSGLCGASPLEDSDQTYQAVHGDEDGMNNISEAPPGTGEANGWNDDWDNDDWGGLDNGPKA